MTVRILDQETKDLVIQLYQEGKLNQREIVTCANVSQRTIHRVIVQAGLATVVERIQGEAYTAMQILKQHQVTVSELNNMLSLGKERMAQIYQELELEDAEIERKAQYELCYE